MKIKAKTALTAAAFSAAAVMSFSGCENDIPEGTYGPPPDLGNNNTVTEILEPELGSEPDPISQNETERNPGVFDEGDVSENNFGEEDISEDNPDEDDISEDNSDEEDISEDAFDKIGFDPYDNIEPAVYGPPME